MTTKTQTNKNTHKQKSPHTPEKYLHPNFTNSFSKKIKIFITILRLKASITDFQLTESLKISVAFTMFCHRTSRLWASKLLLWLWKKSAVHYVQKSNKYLLYCTKKASSQGVTVPSTLRALLFHDYMKSFSEQRLLFTDEDILKED